MTRMLLCSLMIASSLFGTIDSKVDRKVVHEAYIQRDTTLLPFEVLSKSPPPSREEKPPAKNEPGLIWIHGYWSWDREIEDFQWVCGVFRLPPPGQTWVPGYGKLNGDGWFWVPGMWHSEPSNAIHTDVVPPEPSEDLLGDVPGKDYFWAKGHFEYNPYERNFRWFKGSWQKLDPEWVFVPASWQWRPEGYLFRPAYWDYPLEKRGEAFDCTKDNTYQGVPNETLIGRILYNLPDYNAFLMHHYYFHPEFWNGCACTPPWWNWNKWWSFNYLDSWALFWWWSHPGFSAPQWMSFETASKIPPPQEKQIELYKGGKAPYFFSKQGVPSQDDWISALLQTTKTASPLLPSNLWEGASQIAGRNLADNNLRPAGSTLTEVAKPSIKDRVKAYGSAEVPKTPSPDVAPLPPKPVIKTSEGLAPAAKPPLDLWGRPPTKSSR